jgi:hypothetical protein
LIYFNSRNRESGLLRCSNSATQIRLFEHHHECKATVAKKQARACLFTVIGGSAMKKLLLVRQEIIPWRQLSRAMRYRLQPVIAPRLAVDTSLMYLASTPEV